jgi:hypothetical protein
MFPRKQKALGGAGLFVFPESGFERISSASIFYFPNRFVDDPISISILGKIQAGENKFRVKRNLQMLVVMQNGLVRTARFQLTTRCSGNGSLPSPMPERGDGCVGDQWQESQPRGPDHGLPGGRSRRCTPNARPDRRRCGYCHVGWGG